MTSFRFGDPVTCKINGRIFNGEIIGRNLSLYLVRCYNQANVPLSSKLLAYFSAPTFYLDVRDWIALDQSCLFPYDKTTRKPPEIRDHKLVCPDC